MPHYITPSVRLRRTPFSDRVEAAGVTAYTVYNHMLLATVFRSVAEDCAHLKRAVQVWDVACERQVELRGPDAARLLQMATPRDLSRMQDDQCYYVPLVDGQGFLMNDPVAVRLAEDRFWVSLADTDALLYFKGLAAGFGLDVAVFEPDVSPLAIQGPLADELAARVWGEEVRRLRFFRHMPVEVAGRPMLLARSGWSKQGGFELYLEGSEHGPEIWDRLMEAGRDLDVRAGCPNGIERIESGLLSFGNDITMEHTPFEAGLGRYVHDVPGCLANEALKRLADPQRMIRPLEISGTPLPPVLRPWPLADAEGRPAGTLRSAAFSEEFGCNVAIGMVDRHAWAPGTELSVETPAGARKARVRESFWR